MSKRSIVLVSGIVSIVSLFVAVSASQWTVNNPNIGRCGDPPCLYN